MFLGGPPDVIHGDCGDLAHEPAVVLGVGRAPQQGDDGHLGQVLHSLLIAHPTVDLRALRGVYVEND